MRFWRPLRLRVSPSFYSHDSAVLTVHQSNKIGRLNPKFNDLSRHRRKSNRTNWLFLIKALLQLVHQVFSPQVGVDLHYYQPPSVRQVAMVHRSSCVFAWILQTLVIFPQLFQCKVPIADITHNISLFLKVRGYVYARGLGNGLSQEKTR